MRFKHSESGQTLVLAALSMSILLGFVALAANVGLMFQSQRNLQIAADAAATAGALSLRNGNSASVVASAAETATNNNGVTGTLITGSGSAGETASPCTGSGTTAASQTLICVYSSPGDGPNVNAPYYVEVMVRQASPTGLIGMFTASSFMNVAARAVAGAVPGKGCVFALGSGTDLTFTQSGNMTFPNCNIYGDGNLDDTASGNITTNLISIEGTSTRGGSGEFYNSSGVLTSPTTGQDAVADPLAGEISPPTSWPSCLPNTNVSSAGTIGPSGGATIICYDGLNINAGSGTVTLNPGVYVINGTFNISAGGNTTVTGTGVTFYFPNAGDNAQLTGAAKMDLTAPTTAYTSNGADIPAGILFYQNPDDTSLMNISASGTSTLTGVFYLPKAELELSGSATSTLDADVVVGSLDFTGSMNWVNYSDIAGPSPTTPPILVE